MEIIGIREVEVLEIGVFERKSEEASSKRSLFLGRLFDLWHKINFNRIAYFLVIALVARARVFNSLMPFGISMYAVEYMGGAPYTAGALILLATFFPKIDPMLTIKYASAMILFCTTYAKFGDYNIKSAVKRGIIMGASVFLTGFLTRIGSGLLLYDYFMLLIESVIVFGSVYLFYKAKTVIFSGFSRESMSGDDMVPLAAMCGVAIMGAGELAIMGFNISGSLCVLAALVFAYANGGIGGGAAGITIGLIAGLQGGNLTGAIGAYALASLTAGTFSKYGRVGSAVSFILANSLVTFYTNGSTEILINLYEILAASLVFVALPQKVFGILSFGTIKRKNHAAKYKELVKNELASTANSLSVVGKTFLDIAENKLYNTNTAAASFFERTARRVCDGCGLSTHCWKKEFHRTYTSFFVMLEMCDRQGGVSEDDIPEELKNKCRHLDRLLGTFNNMYEVYKVDKLWENRVTESRAMVAAQLCSVSNHLNKMAKRFQSGAAFDTALEDAISIKLNENKLYVRDVFVTNGHKGPMKIIIRLRDDVKADPEKIREITSRVLDTDLHVTESGDGHFRLITATKYKIDLARASEAKDQNPYNGDSTGYLYLEDGSFVLALSDGMGTGERASNDSAATVNIIESLLRAGFDIDTAIGLVNSVLVLKSAEETFTTIDLAMLDFKKCEAEFLKLGAAASFVKKGDEIKMISSSSLPAGVFGQPDLQRTRIKIGAGDMIVMLSDGILEADRKPGGEAWISEMISDYHGSNPRELAERILNAAKERCAKIITDDMTVMVALIREDDAA